VSKQGDELLSTWRSMKVKRNVSEAAVALDATGETANVWRPWTERSHCTWTACNMSTQRHWLQSSLHEGRSKSSAVEKAVLFVISQPTAVRVFTKSA